MKYLASLVLIGLAGMALIGCGQTAPQSLGAASANAPKPPNRVVVYYMHRTFRCFSCLWIEKTVRQTLEESFPSEMSSGRVEFQVEDYWQQKDLANRYDVKTVSVVVVNVVNGREVSHRTLDRVWELKGKTDESRKYIAEAVRAALEKTK